MQTFLAYSSYFKSAEVLDRQRLGKQRVEAYQILNCLSIGPFQKLNGEKWIPLSYQQYDPFDHFHRKTPWYFHPITQLWKGYEYSLAIYGEICCWTWKERGYKDTLFDKFKEIKNNIALKYRNRNDEDKHINLLKPPIIGNEKFHLAMRSNLIRKNPSYYRPIFGYNIPEDLPYIWKI